MTRDLPKTDGLQPRQRPFAIMRASADNVVD